MRRLLTAAALALLVPALPGCKVMQRISDGSYNNAVTDGVVAELHDRGVRLDGRPSCTTQDSGTSVVHVQCTARTSTGEPVEVTGVADDADTRRPRETYVVTVGGREVLRKDCLGLGCR
ncbi:hypothetical protein AGRA3207_005409 [Actinomadura graeca]|uniref:DUF4333 domain-containing protein n=1 Tax=Actinomadura graeca TaxID=2750812 RepID=A0ABX8QZ82_9ACTN|nr:hypothetical protein [Actinomadura graeca]QXJ24145.1 hypothetical protein AGRA3207_005409 [Actinomadura graeca]